MNDKVTTPPGSSLEHNGADLARTRQEKAARRKKAFHLILLDALRGSRPYVESYRAGRGAE